MRVKSWSSVLFQGKPHIVPPESEVQPSIGLFSITPEQTLPRMLWRWRPWIGSLPLDPHFWRGEPFYCVLLFLFSSAVSKSCSTVHRWVDVLVLIRPPLRLQLIPSGSIHSDTYIFIAGMQLYWRIFTAEPVCCELSVAETHRLTTFVLALISQRSTFLFTLPWFHVKH